MSHKRIRKGEVSNRLQLEDGSERLYPIEDDKLPMFAEYIQAAMERATYEIIDDLEPFTERFRSFREYGPPAKP